MNEKSTKEEHTKIRNCSKHKSLAKYLKRNIGNQESKFLLKKFF